MVYLFSGFELDEERFELRHGGALRRVEPRVLEVLIYLLRNRERVVTKEELIHNIWRRKYISESSLTRCVTAARKALANGSPSDEVIRTVHGRGYRFIAAVEETSNRFPPDEVRGSADDGEPRGAAEPRPEKPRRRKAGGWAAMGACAGLALAAIWFWNPWKDERRPEDESSGPVRVALLPISVVDAQPQSELLALSISDLLVTRFSQVRGLMIRPAEHGKALSLESSSVVEFADRSGVRYVISGTLRASEGGRKGHLVMTLHEIRSRQVLNTPLGRYDIPFLDQSVDVSSFVAVRDAVVRDLLRELLPAISLRAADDIAPADAEAYRLYLLGRERLREGGCEGEAALELLQGSLEIDPRFAPAWEAYGWAQYELASSCARGLDHYQKALVAADRALALSPLWVRATGLKATVLVETGRAEEAFAMLREANRRFPGKPDLKAQLFYVLGYSGHLDQARGWLMDLLADDPNYLTDRGWTPIPLLYRGEIDLFLRYLPGTDAPPFRYYRGLAEFTRGRPEVARHVLEPAFRLNPADTFARMAQALLAIIEQDPKASIAVLDGIARQRRIVGATDGEMSYRMAQLYVLAGDREAGLQQLSIAVDQGFFCAACLERDPHLDRIRTSGQYRRILTRARDRHRAFGRQFGLKSPS